MNPLGGLGKSELSATYLRTWNMNDLASLVVVKVEVIIAINHSVNFEE